MGFIKNHLGLIFTVVGMLFAAVGQIITTKDNNQLETDKKKQLDSINNLGIENKALAVENKKLGIENKSLAIENKDLAIENKDLAIENNKNIKENKDLVIENIKISSENKDLAIHQKKTLEQTSKQMNNEAYFLGFPHSYIANFFTDGSVFIFRQTKDGIVFKKSIANNNDIGFENIDAKVIVNKSNKKNSSIEIIHKHSQFMNGIIINNYKSTGVISMDTSDVGKMQVFSGLGIENHPDTKSDYSRNYFRLVTIDDEGFTYAIGRAAR